MMLLIASVLLMIVFVALLVALAFRPKRRSGKDDEMRKIKNEIENEETYESMEELAPYKLSRNRIPRKMQY